VQNKIEVSQIIDQRGLSGLQINVMVMSALVVLLDGYHIQSMSVVVGVLASQWSVESRSFGMVMASALAGIAVGGAFLGPLGDRWGRCIVMVVSMVVVGASSICTGFAANMEQLLVWRFLTGLGLGASLPNATALTSEYVPTKRRAALVTLMYAGVPIGAFTAAFVVDPINASFGWQGIFTIGGALAVGVAVLLGVVAPESVRLLLVRKPNDPRIPKILARLAPEVDPRSVYAQQPTIKRQSMIELLREKYRRGTLLLWLVFFFNLFVLYLLVNWLPTLLHDQGWSTAQANRGAGIIQAGGVAGGILLSLCVDRGRTVAGMASAYLLTAIAFGLFMVLPSNGPSWWLLLVVVGGGISGCQFALNALAAGFYPPIIRATGVGWAFSIGRIGAILSPIVGGWIMKMKVPPISVLGMLVIPVLICVVGVLMFRNIFNPPSAAPPKTAGSGAD
jgi:MFS transporter, AAHS family, 4-hydroxybenzoate transporter